MTDVEVPGTTTETPTDDTVADPTEDFDPAMMDHFPNFNHSGGLGGYGGMPHDLYGHDGIGSDYEFPYNSDYGYGQKNFLERHERAFHYLTIVLCLFLLWSFVTFHKDGVKNWWDRRRAAARYKRAKKDDSVSPAEEAGEFAGSDEEPTFMETIYATFTRDKSTKVTVEMEGGKTHQMDAQIGALQKVSELPFFLQQGCRYSGNGELAALSLVDLWLHDRARITLSLQQNGEAHTVGKTTTANMVRRARSFKVVILPQATR